MQYVFQAPKLAPDGCFFHSLGPSDGQVFSLD